MRDRARDWSEQGRRPRVPLARSSLSITVDEKRKGLRAVYPSPVEPNYLGQRTKRTVAFCLHMFSASPCSVVQWARHPWPWMTSPSPTSTFLSLSKYQVQSSLHVRDRHSQFGSALHRQLRNDTGVFIAVMKQLEQRSEYREKTRASMNFFFSATLATV